MLQQSPDGSDFVADGPPGPSVVPVPTNGAGDDADLAEILADLSRLSAARLGLEDLLTRLATYAVHAIPGADGAGLTLIEKDRADTIVKSATFVKQVDDIQYGLNEGPCILAAATGNTVRSGSLSGDPRWPRFGPLAGQLGVNSVLSLPLPALAKVIGTLNVYAHPKNAFDDRAQYLGQLFAVPAAIAVQKAQILAQTRRLALQLQQALLNRVVIDQAIGIIIARDGATPDEALGKLRTLSQKEHIKMSVVASALVEATAQHATDRNGSGDTYG